MKQGLQYSTKARRSSHCTMTRQRQSTYSFQIKQLMMEKYANNKTVFEISRELSVPYGTVASWARKIDMGGDILADNRGGRRNVKITEAISQYIIDTLDSECWLTMVELKNKIQAHFGVTVGRSTLSWHVLHKLRITFKIIKSVVVSRNTEEVKDDRVAYVEWLMAQDEYEVNHHFVWIDESGCAVNMFKRRGYAPEGVTPMVSVPQRGKRVNVVGAISGHGLVNVEVFSPVNRRDNFDATKFLAFLQSTRRILQNYCDMHDIAYDRIHLIMDNARIHHALVLQEWFDTCPFTIKFLPRYSPMLNPIEEVKLIYLGVGSNEKRY